MDRRQFFRRVGGIASVPAVALAGAYSTKTAAAPTFVDGETLTAKKLNDAFQMVVNGNVLVRGQIITTQQRNDPTDFATLIISPKAK